MGLANVNCFRFYTQSIFLKKPDGTIEAPIDLNTAGVRLLKPLKRHLVYLGGAFQKSLLS